MFGRSKLIGRNSREARLKFSLKPTALVYQLWRATALMLRHAAKVAPLIPKPRPWFEPELFGEPLILACIISAKRREK
jgi:hypothetical protein